MSAQTSLTAHPASPVLPNIPVRPPTTTPPPVPTPTAAPDFPRLYGPPGWTVRIGLWRLLEPWLDTPRCLPGESPLRLDARGGPVSDYVLSRLPAAALRDRQNLAPSLKTMLTACAGADGQVRLCGYGIGPQREDERLSVEALWVADADLQGYEVLVEHSRDCQCSALWERVKDRYELDAGGIPDDIVRTRPEWAGGGVGWWMWWD